MRDKPRRPNSRGKYGLCFDKYVLIMINIRKRSNALKSGLFHGSEPMMKGNNKSVNITEIVHIS